MGINVEALYGKLEGGGMTVEIDGRDFREIQYETSS
jgi:hypothetical protein